MKRSILVLALASLSCGSPPLIHESGDLQVRTQWKTATGEQALDFGPVPVLDSKTLRISLHNIGRVPVKISPLPKLADDSAIFKIDFTPEQTTTGNIVIAAGQQLQLPITFVPIEEADYTGEISIVSNSSSNPLTKVALVGKGSTVGKLQLTPNALDFNRVCEETQDVKTVAIDSVGTGPLIIQSVELVDAPKEIAIAGSASVPARLDPPANGQPGGRVEIPIRCSPVQSSGTDLSATLKIGSTDPTQRVVTVPITCKTNRAPITAIAPLTVSPAPGRTVPLDGSGSYDPDGDTPLTFFWSSDSPPGSNSDFSDHASAKTSLPLDVAGNYSVHLDVVDASGCSCIPEDNGHCVTQKLQALSPDDLKFELVWDNPRTDLDIHVVQVPGDYYGDKDCYWGNDKGTTSDPLGFLDDCGDFGIESDPSDDPAVSPDDLEGYGPEVVVLGLGNRVVANGTYEVGAVYSKTNGADDPTTHATIRVYVYGVLVAQKSALLAPPSGKTPGDRWQAFDVTWPDAANQTGGVDYVGTIGKDSAP